MSVDKATLLKDLRKQVTALEDDLRERTEAEPEISEALNAEYAEARKAERTALTYGQWRDDRVTQAAVAWILATVFVRFCEDNDLIADPWIAGPGDRLAEADERHQEFFRRHPEKNDRDWLVEAFDHLAGTNETVEGLFDRDHNPLWGLPPSYEAASDLLKFWRRTGPDGEIVHDFTDDLDTRFLGDLYQDLSDHAKKTYALLQTPEFVEEFILDLTLEPAIEEFGLEPPWRHKPAGWPGDDPVVRGLRTIDPACGSGHFLLGIFHRLLAKWQAEAPGLDRWEQIRRTLESIHGCDKNPFAAEIARFRLLVAALHAAGETRLDRAPSFPINVAVGDSLLHGRGARTPTPTLFSAKQFTYTTEDINEFAERRDLLGMNSYHVVVANPPYITVKDKQENENYRAYNAAAGKYALSVPFAQRIFELAIRTGGSDRAAGFTGQITSNSFMKREFGKKLIDWFHKEVDLTHVVDTSGAYIPGHGTPTVILAGRNRTALGQSKIRAILGVRGEPSQPADPADGLVWNAIVDQIARPGSESEWVSAADLERSMLAGHPWSLSGGGAGDLRELIEAAAIRRLGSIADSIGITAVTGEDDLFLLPTNGAARRLGVTATRPMIVGDAVRDHCVQYGLDAIWMYDEKLETLAFDELGPTTRLLWSYRSAISQRKRFGVPMVARGMSWCEWQELYPSKFRTAMSIVYGEVATHNHFALDRGGKVFKQTAPVIKLPEGVGEDEHLALLGLLNSSTACFWLKQVSHDKGNRGGERSTGRYAWENYFQFNSSKIERFPLPVPSVKGLARHIDDLVQDYRLREPSSLAGTVVPSRAVLDDGRSLQSSIRARMISAQEELDWQVYDAYGLLSDVRKEDVGFSDPYSTPEVRLGERAFEIVLARRVVTGEVGGEWFDRHGSTPITEVPERWPEEYRRVVQARIDLIEEYPKTIGLLERSEYKRRWSAESWEQEEREALRAWILDRCEGPELWYGLRDGLQHPRALTVSQLADQFRDDKDMQNVAALYADDHLDKRDLPMVKVLEEVIADEHVPYLAAMRYTDIGLRKREEWERVWELQREEDRTGERLDIAVPPKYAPKDFQKNSYWSQRGKLDVPKERFISYPGASPDSDGTLLLGWAGWDHKDQAQALVNLVNDRTEQAAWGEEKLQPLLAGLLEVMPWVHQWHGEYDSEWEGVPAEEFQAFLDDQRSQYQLSEDDLKSWRPPAKGRGRKKA
ncbi:BREX-2 system adenine-specific DNA-methyltransferase PglX [Spirillospora sp. NPDC047279]|uniref:BREX-2 system adenine-specific DNA-methyltransferase PglX n=1 Tax=Spirillospora sp. NPDC047279 TaxID=3155478 RepID=UPI0033E96B0B